MVQPAAPGLVRASKPAGQFINLRDFVENVKSLLAPYKYLRWVEFVRELPKTATGKIQRYKLRATRRR
jgi:benzoate-CoA ligase